MKVEVSDLCFGYNSKLVLENVNMVALPGEITTIIGPNGSGKSTLLKCMAGMLKPNGKILLNGSDLRKFKKREIAKFVGYISQDHYIEAILTVFEIVLLGRIHTLSWRVSDKDLEATLKVLKDLRIEKFAFKCIDELSGGQRQLVFIAQSLVKEPKILLMDEPVSNLDIKHQLEILNLIRGITLKNKITTIIVLHDLNLAARFADKIVVLDNGKVYSCGKPEFVLTSTMLTDVYEVEAKISRNNGIIQIIPLKPLEGDIYTDP